MKIAKFSAQIQCELDDGAVLVLNIPVSLAKPDLNLSEVKDLLKTLTLDSSKVVKKPNFLPEDYEPRILSIHNDFE